MSTQEFKKKKQKLRILDDYKYQKDWLVYDAKEGKLLCLTIISKDGIDWYLAEFANYFDLSTDELQDKLNDGIASMIDANNEYYYRYVIAEHRFSKQEFEREEYWRKYFPKKEDRLNVKKSLSMKKDYKIDKKNFEEKLSVLVNKKHIKSEG